MGSGESAALIESDIGDSIITVDSGESFDTLDGDSRLVARVVLGLPALRTERIVSQWWPSRSQRRHESLHRPGWHLAFIA